MRLWPIGLVLAALFVIGRTLARADPLATVLARHRRALGGAAAVARAGRLRLHARVRCFGLDGTLVELSDGGRRRSELRLGDVAYEQVDVWDGRALTRQGPNGDVRVLGATEAAAARTEAAIATFDYLRGDAGRAGAAVRLLPPSAEGGRRYQRLEVTAAGGAPVVLWLDGSGLPRRRVSTSGGVVTTVFISEYGDYHGLKIARKMTIRRASEAGERVVEVEAVELAPDIGDDAFAAPAPRPDARFPAGAAAVTLPLRLLDGGAPLVSGRLGAVEGTFLVDTGASASVYDRALLSAIGVVPRGELVPAAGAFAGIAFARVPPLTVHGLELAAQTVLAVDLRHGGGPPGVDGILGYDFVSRFPMTLDYEARTLTFWDPARFTPPPGALKVAAEIESTTLKVPVRVGSQPAGWFTVDSGNAGPVAVQHAGAARAAVRLGPRPYRLAEGLRFGTGGAAAFLVRVDLAVGEGARALTWHGAEVLLLDLGDRRAATIAGAGNLGVEWLARVRATFDYGGRAVYLEEPRRLAATAARGHFGFTVALGPRGLLVDQVVPAWPAAAAGVRVGDLLVAVDGAAPARERLHALFTAAPPGAAHAFTFARGDERVEARLVAEALP